MPGKDFADSHDKIPAAIEGASQVQAFGTQAAFDQYILNRVVSAVEVKNTFVSYKPAAGNSSAVDQNSLASYVKFFKSERTKNEPKRWIDIVSYNEFFGPRYKALNDRLGQLGKNSRHVVRVIRHNIPMLNFTIFYYDSFVEEREVVFGWLHSDVSHSRRLFRSTNPALIDMFESVFTLFSQYRLQGDVELAYGSKNIRIASQASDRQGWRYCVGQSEDDRQAISESIFRITFLEHSAEIDGKAIWLDNYGNQKSTNGANGEYINHKSDKISYTSNKLFLEYRSPDLARRGICVYNFSTSDGHAILNGYLHDAGMRERVQLRGIWIDDLTKDNLLDDAAFEAARSKAEGTFMSEVVRDIRSQRERGNHSTVERSGSADK